MKILFAASEVSPFSKAGGLSDVVGSLPKWIEKDAEVAINAVFGAIGDALAKGEAVQLIGFGTFGVKERAAREGRNPRTGEVVKIAASKIPTFKAGKALKDKVQK